ncbi:hypothetical protein DFA_01304 [Cavenderia fasciculata]|uniref:Ankyrin repeat-containing protein n=1 Tax=Cavenderia fasciculata TaxID=261658 RepID=F4PRY4_CACFS|nr:uncharacterized protein DFA_01304 [Cavenderia fasciculata]EGG21420.1 hypothetical protein DFA_01304 [Cavenderia fasciculata]|eukprot:XP_004359270.1 hypothetical protein DFA_01304 [Cavenderia fasciculata]
MTELESISRSTDKNLIKEWLKKHPLTMVHNNHQHTLIHLVSMNGNMDYVNLEEIKPLELRDKDGYTAMHCAVNQGHFEMAEKLLVKGSDPNARTSTGSTPLHLLSKYCHAPKAIKLASLLIEAGAFINHKDIKFEAPLHRATLPTNNNEFLKLLLLNGANPNILNKRGRTPIHVAIEEGRIDILLTFMEHGALFTKSSLSSSFPSPLEYALQSKNPQIVQFFNERIGSCGEYIIWMEKLNLFYGKNMQNFSQSGDSYSSSQHLQLIHGGVFITNYRVVFRCENSVSNPSTTQYSLNWPFGDDEEMSIALASIESITTENHPGINHQSNLNNINNINNTTGTTSVVGGGNSNNNSSINLVQNVSMLALGGSGGQQQQQQNTINSTSLPNLGGSGNSTNGITTSSNWANTSNSSNNSSINININIDSNNNNENDEMEKMIHRLNNNTSSSYLYLSKDDFWTGSNDGSTTLGFTPNSGSNITHQVISSTSSSFVSGQHCELNINSNGQIVNSTPINYYSIVITTKNFKHCKIYFLNSAMRDKVVDIITYHYKTKVEKSLKLIDTNRRLQNKIVKDNIILDDHSRIEHIDRFECYGVFEEPLPYLYAHVYRSQRPPNDGWLVYQPKKDSSMPSFN